MENMEANGDGTALRSLSQRESQVMRLIALGHTTKEIAFELSLSAKTVSTYRTRLMGKTKLKSNAEITRFAARPEIWGQAAGMRA
jgi:two-component system invasion response regulator UvrY